MTKVMASVTSPTTGSSRRRITGTAKESTSEDQALNMIAKEAEARLAAKRAARAEARSIRMKEIEKKQQEKGDEDEFPDINGPKEKRFSLPRSSAILTRSTTVIGDAYVRSASLVPDISDQVSNDLHKQLLELKEMVRLGEEKYKKAMVNSAQLDNERQTLLYQVEVLKDIIEELQQRIENTDDELLDKNREHNKLIREHSVTGTELNKCLFLIEERERVLDEHGINIDGTMKEGYSSSTSTGLCSSCQMGLNDEVDTLDYQREKGTLLAEINSLKSEIIDLKETHNFELSRLELNRRDNVLCDELYIGDNKTIHDVNVNVDRPKESFEIPSVKLSTDTTGSGNRDRIRKRSKKRSEGLNIIESSSSSLKVNVDNENDDNHSPLVSPTGSATSTSNININNYLSGDYNDDTLNDTSEQQYNAFRLSRYFDNDVTNSSIDTSTHNENNEIETSLETITKTESESNDMHTNSDEPSCVDNQNNNINGSPCEAVEELVTIDNVPIEMSAPDNVFDNSGNSEISLYYQVNTSKGEGSDSVNSSVESPMNTAFCEDDTESNHKLSRVQKVSITQVIRNDVEELYNQIADEATVEKQTTESVSSEQFNPAFPVPVLPPGPEHKGWKVWLENSIVQKLSENKASNSEPTDSTEPEPKPKERKKKKKSKKKLV